ncbi:NAD(P)-dependent oxidoreductase [Thermodesulfomicrobium sp. WS]|uniref:dTDP-4-dehydrorhamnose reductase n=1 Tax=Thermodesulfomicrobium sp. WS TaxID=3004129 RepID=UPI002490BD5C|nr:dTDP-4-dehydrorhamnose reductase [Thermodesulfomicrobium sp. WS]BDV00732.1 NAD(P)-dependent oxidoreductase [Thermodesulfomicrobium sp. WS]
MNTALVFGGRTGLLGQALCAALTQAGWRAVPIGRTDVDLWDVDALRALVTQVRPQVVFNAIAYTAVDRAEDEPQEAWRVNALFPRLLGQAVGTAHLVHYSTDYVFDGRATRPYLPTDPVNPQCVYGRTKLEGETELTRLGLARLTIVRTAWLFGPGRMNFVARILELARSRPELTIVHDQVGSPTFTPDLAAASLALVQAGATGIFHAVNAGQASWCELAAEAVHVAGIACPVRPITSAEYPQKAARPAYSVLDTTSLTAATGMTPRSWALALREYIRALR